MGNLTDEESPFESPEEDSGRWMLLTIFTESIFGSIADFVIVLVLVSFKQLRSKRNILIANWACSDLIFWLSEVGKYKVFFGRNCFSKHETLHCILLRFQTMVYCYVILTVIALHTDLFYKRMTVSCLLRVLPFTTAAYVVLSVIAASTCGVIDSLFITYYFMGCFALLFAVYVVKLLLYLVRRARSKPQKPQLRFIITTGYISCWFIGIIFLLIAIFQNHIPSMYFSFVAQCIGYTSPVVTLILLLLFDHNFKVYFFKLFRCDKSQETLFLEKGTDNVVEIPL